MSFPKTKRPRDVRVLDRWIRDLAENNDTAANRTRRSLSYVVVAAALAQLREDDGTPLFVLKGGVAMQLRFGSRARLSNDYDAAFRRKIVEHLEAVLAQAPACPVGEFRARAIGKPEPLGPTGAFRQAESYERTALENGFPVTDIKSAVAAVEAIVQRIDPSG